MNAIVTYDNATFIAKLAKGPTGTPPASGTNWDQIAVVTVAMPTLAEVTTAGATTTNNITVGVLTASSLSSDGGAVSTDGSGNLTVTGSGMQVLGPLNIERPSGADVTLHPNDGGYLNLNGNGGVAISSGNGFSVSSDGIDTAFGDFTVIAGKSESPNVRNIIFDSGSAEVMRILGSGNLGIGTSTPATLLDVAGDSSSNTFIAKPQSATPSSPSEGQIYYDNGTKHFYGWNGTSWAQLDN